jgi:hypothetical protein
MARGHLLRDPQCAEAPLSSMTMNDPGRWTRT